MSNVALHHAGRMKSVKMAPRFFCLAAALLLAIVAASCGDGDDGPLEEVTIGDAPAIKVHTSQEDINSGKLTLEEIIERGKALFVTSFNTLDGAGRPETADIARVNNVSVINSRPRREFPDNFNRISGPDANTCVACHNLPRLGGGGDNSTNIFVRADEVPFASFDGGAGDRPGRQTLRAVGDERNSVGLFGAGFIELLAREMSVELRSIANEAVEESKSKNTLISKELVAKGVKFGRITARPDGVLDTSEVEGIDADLVIRPFQQKGAVASLREFTVKATNSHFGMQAAENFPFGGDADRDGVTDELTIGDITALVIFQATIPVPGQVVPSHPKARAAAERGSVLFSEIQCASCHITKLRLNNPVFTEPGPFNPGGKLQPKDVSTPLAVDLTTAGPAPRLQRQLDGAVWVPAFTDLKRHKMGEGLNNELLEQDGVPTDEWLTRKLWGFASEPPFLHHGRATLISEAILAHGGEAQDARNAFAALSPDDQAAVVEFLKTLQVLPEGSIGVIITDTETASASLGAWWAAIGVMTGAVFLVVSGGVALALRMVRRQS